MCVCVCYCFVYNVQLRKLFFFFGSNGLYNQLLISLIFFLFQLQTREAENDAQQKRLTNLVIENPFIVLHCVLQI